MRKNKEQREAAERKARKEERQNRRHTQEPGLKRREEGTRQPRQRILIYCEGENTEPSYFKQFRVANAEIKVMGEGYNTLSLVQRAIELREEAKNAGRAYDQVWCVFDRDPPRTNGGGHSASNFNDAIKLAKKEGLQVAYSIQAFEYWLILHFNDHQGSAINRDDYDGMLNQYLKEHNCTYDGRRSKEVTRQIFDVLEAKDKSGKARRELACDRAERIHNRHLEEGRLIKPAGIGSTTTVYALVRQLLADRR